MQASKSNSIQSIKCPACSHVLATYNEQAYLCTECGRRWSQQNIHSNRNARRYFPWAIASIIVCLVLVTFPPMIDRSDFGFPSKGFPLVAFLAGIVCIPVFGFPVAMWSHLGWRANCMRGKPATLSIVISDVVVRWIISTFLLACFVLAAFLAQYFLLGIIETAN